jgi:hypothetical protein
VGWRHPSAGHAPFHACLLASDDDLRSDRGRLRLDGRGRLADDFLLAHRGPVVAVANAPSPAATASLAVARLVADAVART